jgi:hypothetical protein
MYVQKKIRDAETACFNLKQAKRPRYISGSKEDEKCGLLYYPGHPVALQLKEILISMEIMLAILRNWRNIDQ